MSTLTLPSSSVVDNDEALSVREVAERHNISIATVNRRIADGHLPAVVFRGRRFILESDANAAFAPRPAKTRNDKTPPIDATRLARLRALLGGQPR